ncbi:2-oxo-4-hydroxy-4-carboxy-5-ureidoimidazoline decarboxylase [Lentzea atacamensis]|uniref:2-oxo-4-hydroxy-4-carboxy-5-ureidoimidazoline decarboxylase n=2 Tax=Lentzea TaxID=165301 RepID=A0A316I6U4_9PSEU|nr:2-oxo-4-hydroxy-4-carboxy-5-ureidoimidazoline decarboxylase [Lentzea flava]PWK89172.1 2-oxo-4-hydroxy-4-carboxy-5-ureidoimidazoline decarboxylase [Lentzea atacamensis]RAS61893.1 2-oxo-4-hydroxy-4-carboxy-5-ureidoimidazoline decarboxylase [Lentzea atacamensis]GGU56134.1 OHCU decarboxylase [Lentzea flava]
MESFNSAPEAELRPLLTECLAVPRWVDAIVAGRPYASMDALLAASHVAAQGLSDEEVLGAIAGHPRIGERQKTGGVSAKWSRSEQSGVDSSQADRLAAANAAYEDRFGHIYLVCATGLSGAEMLDNLSSRMDNPPDVELRVVNDELAKIAALRLQKLIGS